MDVTATEAKNRLGQILDACQREPVVIEKSGRRHSVLLSAAHYDALVAAARPAGMLPEGASPGEAFYAKYKDWVDMQNELVDKHGIPGEEFRAW
jgi:prevent-host-death family protein